MRHQLKRCVALVAISAAAATMAIPQSGCKEKAQPVALAPAAVSVSKPLQEKVSDFVEFTGTTEALASVDVRARVKGFLKKVNFTEGSYVKEGDLLFEIEPDIFQAMVDRDTGCCRRRRRHAMRGGVGIALESPPERCQQARRDRRLSECEDRHACRSRSRGASLAKHRPHKDIRGVQRAIDRTGGRGNLVGDRHHLLANIVSNDPCMLISTSMSDQALPGRLKTK
jgi:hypothetical protein